MEENSAPCVEDRLRAFKNRGFVVLPKLVIGPALTFFHDYTRKVAKVGVLGAPDSQVPNTSAGSADPFMESLQEELRPVIETVSGCELYPTYIYFRVYKHGDSLARHRDRPACEISVTLSLGYAALEPWPIWVQQDGVDCPISLHPGDGLLYKGCDLPHWREVFSGDYAAQLFLHYVDKNGPQSEWKYDKRPEMETWPVAARLLRQFSPYICSQLRPSPAGDGGDK